MLAKTGFQVSGVSAAAYRRSGRLILNRKPGKRISNIES
ncbi:hypothetical protein D1AOALGA4SA_8004 [Olavius algarvensis Delta 1 endosymbiont]|nr:hypothetical protein D1AOALGA4SA_8004 [Olavius algarvensis Delta 1 endosymbiont]